MRTQRNAQFQGLYTYLDLFDGTWRDREGYSGDTQFFKSETGAFDANRPDRRALREEEPRRRRTSRPCAAFLSGIALTGNAQRDYLLGNVDIPQVINMRPSRRSSTTTTSRRRTSTSRCGPQPAGGR